MMMKHLIAGAAVAMSLFSVGEVSAMTITLQTFDVPPTLSDTQAPGAWYTDRYAPAGFQNDTFAGDDRLKLSLSASDGATGRPSGFGGAFYNTQGRKFDTAGATSLSVDFYLDPLFETATGRIAGLWGTGFDISDTISGYPVLEFANAGFQFWDGAGFQSAMTAFTYGTFANLLIELDTTADLFRFFVDGDAVGTSDANGSVQLGNGFLQGYNTAAGVDRDIYFDNFKATSPVPIPVPAALPLMLLALGGLGLAARRRRSA